MKILEANRVGRPPSWTSFFRHPLVVAIFGIFIYTLNIQIIGKAAEAKHWANVGGVFLIVFYFLVFEAMVYSIRYIGPNEDWQFERCIRWYRLRREEVAGAGVRTKSRARDVR